MPLRRSRPPRPRCVGGGPRIERPERGAGGALVLSVDFREGEEYIPHSTFPLHLLMHSHDGLLPVYVALCILSSRRDSREGEKGWGCPAGGL